MSLHAIAGGIYGALNHASVTGTGLAVGGIHRSKAPHDTVFPYVVFTVEPSASVGAVLTGESWLDVEWDVQVVDKSESAALADTIYAAAHARLQDAALTVTGHTLLYCRRRGLIGYDEDGDGGVTYQHVGGRYRIMAQAA